MQLCERDHLHECQRKIIRSTSSFLGINANQGQVFPQLLQKVIQVQLHATAKIHTWTEKIATMMSFCVHEKLNIGCKMRKHRNI